MNTIQELQKINQRCLPKVTVGEVDGEGYTLDDVYQSNGSLASTTIYFLKKDIGKTFIKKYLKIPSIFSENKEITEQYFVFVGIDNKKAFEFDEPPIDLPDGARWLSEDWDCCVWFAEFSDNDSAVNYANTIQYDPHIEFSRNN